LCFCLQHPNLGVRVLAEYVRQGGVAAEIVQLRVALKDL
jgi:hypothetical protein